VQIEGLDRESRSERCHRRRPVRRAEGGKPAAGRNTEEVAEERRMKRTASVISIFLLTAGAAFAQAPVKVDSDTISGLGARNIGSAAMSGRIAAIDAVWEGQRLTVYVGSASGGVWKSQNSGTTYKPVFDKQPVQSIGAVAIDPKAPKTV